MSLQDFFIYDSNDVSGTCFTSATDNEQYQIEVKEVYIIYKTTNMINGKIYIGQHKIESPELSATFDGYLGSGMILINSINKYGEENFYRETLELCYGKKLTDEREIYWIATLSATDRNIGYNIGLGGNGGNNLTNNPRRDEILKKMSKTMIGRFIGEKHWNFGKKTPKESREKMSKSHKGKTLSEEHKQHISESLRGRKRTEEHRNNLSKSLTGKKATEEHKQHISESLRGKSSPKKGKKQKPLSEEHKQKISQTMKERKINVGNKNPTKRPEVRQKISETVKKNWENKKNL